MAPHNESRNFASFERLIGRMEATIENVQRTLDSERSAAAVHRGEIRAQIAELARKVDPLVDDMREIKPLVMEHEQTRQRGLGIAWMVRVVWAVVGGGLLYMASKLFKF